MTAKITLTWDNGSSEHVDQIVYRSESAFTAENLPVILARVGRNAREYTDETVVTGSTYFYAVASENALGELLLSSVISVKADVIGGDPHWNSVVALLYFDGDLSDSASTEQWVVTGSSHTFVDEEYPAVYFENARGRSNTTLWKDQVSDFEFSGDFTIELFIRSDAANQNLDILACTIPFWSPPAATFRMESGRLRFVAYGPPVASPVAFVPIGIRTHVAVCRIGGDLVFFMGGTEVQRVVNYFNSGFIVNFSRGGTSIFDYLGFDQTGPFYGTVDNLRITKGVARYTENFTPPTEPFPNY